MKPAILILIPIRNVFTLRMLHLGLISMKEVSKGVKSTKKAATMSRVFCTFFPQKGTQKLPGRCLRLLRPG